MCKFKNKPITKSETLKIKKNLNKDIEKQKNKYKEKRQLKKTAEYSI